MVDNPQQPEYEQGQEPLPSMDAVDLADTPERKLSAMADLLRVMLTISGYDRSKVRLPDQPPEDSEGDIPQRVAELEERFDGIRVAGDLELIHRGGSLVIALAGRPIPPPAADLIGRAYENWTNTTNTTAITGQPADNGDGTSRITVPGAFFTDNMLGMPAWFRDTGNIYWIEEIVDSTHADVTGDATGETSADTIYVDDGQPYVRVHPVSDLQGNAEDAGTSHTVYLVREDFRDDVDGRNRREPNIVDNQLVTYRAAANGSYICTSDYQDEAFGVMQAWLISRYDHAYPSGLSTNLDGAPVYDGDPPDTSTVTLTTGRLKAAGHIGRMLRLNGTTAYEITAVASSLVCTVDGDASGHADGQSAEIAAPVPESPRPGWKLCHAGVASPTIDMQGLIPYGWDAADADYADHMAAAGNPTAWTAKTHGHTVSANSVNVCKDFPAEQVVDYDPIPTVDAVNHMNPGMVVAWIERYDNSV